MGPMLFKQCRTTALVKIRAIGKTDGVNAWRELSHWFSASSEADQSALMGMIMHPDKATQGPPEHTPCLG